MYGKEDLGLRNLIIEGVDGFDLTQIKDSKLIQLGAKNPVENPPFNNWSVNQPSPPHAHGMRGNEDLGLRNIIIEGVDGYDLT